MLYSILLCCVQLAAASTENHFGAREGIENNLALLQQEEATRSSHLKEGRANALIIDANNSPNRGNVNANQSDVWRYPRDLLMGAFADSTPGLPNNVSEVIERSLAHEELRRRDGELDARQSDSRTAYISINTCSQPAWSSGDEQEDGPPQLVLYIGLSGNQNPGPGSAGQQNTITLQEGFARTTMLGSSDIYMAVAAQNLPSTFRGSWAYDIAISINNFYHGANMTVPFLYLADTDATSALLVTDNLTQADSSDELFKQWTNLLDPLPFTVFGNPSSDNRRLGMQSSYCGLENIRQIGGRTNAAGATASLETNMITRGLGNKPKQQFLVSALTKATEYDVSLALVGNGAKSGKGVVGGGGIVWQPTGWTTKMDGNCQLLYDLPFCSEVAYAAPSNPNNYNITGLAALYDNYAASMYQNFTYSIQQVQCNATNDAMYSLTRNCNDCKKAYKQWLCAVTIPRCEDFSNNASFLQPRNVGQKFFQNQSMLSDDILNTPYRPMLGAPTLPGSPIDQTYISAFATKSSRNPAIIDNLIQPGPYKEVLPCDDLCYSLVQSCPAALQFACPLPGRGLETDYHKRPDSLTAIECSYLGAVYYVDDAARQVPNIAAIMLLGTLIVYLAAT